MRICRKATIRENLMFQKEYCTSAESRENLVHNFYVTVEIYEELPPWYSTYNADGSDIRLKDDVIMLRVRDFNKLIEYYPVFPASEGLRLLHKWKMDVPPKLTAFAYYLPKEKPAPENACLRNLIAYSRLFMLGHGTQHPKMAFGFNNLYKQLHDVPACSVSPEAVKLINSVIGAYMDEAYGEQCDGSQKLQNFINRVIEFYPLLRFQSNDFERLREKLKRAYPDEKINF